MPSTKVGKPRHSDAHSSASGAQERLVRKKSEHRYTVIVLASFFVFALAMEVGLWLGIGPSFLRHLHTADVWSCLASSNFFDFADPGSSPLLVPSESTADIQRIATAKSMSDDARSFFQSPLTRAVGSMVAFSVRALTMEKLIEHNEWVRTGTLSAVPRDIFAQYQELLEPFAQLNWTAANIGTPATSASSSWLDLVSVLSAVNVLNASGVVEDSSSQSKDTWMTVVMNSTESEQLVATFFEVPNTVDPTLSRCTAIPLVVEGVLGNRPNTTLYPGLASYQFEVCYDRTLSRKYEGEVHDSAWVRYLLTYSGLEFVVRVKLELPGMTSRVGATNSVQNGTSFLLGMSLQVPYRALMNVFPDVTSEETFFEEYFLPALHLSEPFGVLQWSDAAAFAYKEGIFTPFGTNSSSAAAFLTAKYDLDASLAAGSKGLLSPLVAGNGLLFVFIVLLPLLCLKFRKRQPSDTGGARVTSAAKKRPVSSSSASPKSSSRTGPLAKDDPGRRSAAGQPNVHDQSFVDWIGEEEDAGGYGGVAGNSMYGSMVDGMDDGSLAPERSTIANAEEVRYSCGVRAVHSAVVLAITFREYGTTWTEFPQLADVLLRFLVGDLIENAERIIQRFARMPLAASDSDIANSKTTSNGSSNLPHLTSKSYHHPNGTVYIALYPHYERYSVPTDESAADMMRRFEAQIKCAMLVLLETLVVVNNEKEQWVATERGETETRQREDQTETITVLAPVRGLEAELRSAGVDASAEKPAYMTDILEKLVSLEATLSAGPLYVASHGFDTQTVSFFGPAMEEITKLGSYHSVVGNPMVLTTGLVAELVNQYWVSSPLAAAASLSASQGVSLSSLQNTSSTSGSSSPLREKNFGFVTIIPLLTDYIQGDVSNDELKDGLSLKRKILFCSPQQTDSGDGPSPLSAKKKQAEQREQNGNQPSLQQREFDVLEVFELLIVRRTALSRVASSHNAAILGKLLQAVVKEFFRNILAADYEKAAEVVMKFKEEAMTASLGAPPTTELLSAESEGEVLLSPSAAPDTSPRVLHSLVHITTPAPPVAGPASPPDAAMAFLDGVKSSCKELMAYRLNRMIAFAHALKRRPPASVSSPTDVQALGQDTTDPKKEWWWPRKHSNWETFDDDLAVHKNELAATAAVSGPVAARQTAGMTAEDLLAGAKNEASDLLQELRTRVEGRVEMEKEREREIAEKAAAAAEEALAKQEEEGEEDGGFSLFNFIPLPEEEEAEESNGDGQQGADNTAESDDPPLVFTDMRGERWRRSERSLGKGAFGVVYLGMGTTGNMVAIKAMSISKLPLEECDVVAKEVSLLIRLRHENVVEYLSSALIGHFFLIVMESVGGGSLHGLLVQYTKLSEACVRRYLIDTLSGLRYLHTNGVLHRDVKPQNVLLTSDGHAKLADFGAAGFLGQRNTLKKGDIQGTILYMAPEACRGVIHPRCDIWSVGIMTYLLLTGEFPWHPADVQLPHVILNKLGRDPSFFPTTELLEKGSAARKFVLSCLQIDPEIRPSADELLQDPFLVAGLEEG